MRISSGAWYALSIITLLHAVHFLDRAVIPNLVEPIRREFQLSDAQLGALTGLAYGVSFALAGLPLGYLADRTNRRKLLSVLVVVWSGLTALSAAAQHFFTLFVTRMGVGAAEAGAGPVEMSLIVDLFPARARATALGIYYVGISIGALANAVVAALIAAHYGWRWALLAAGIPGTVLGLLAWVTLGDIPRGPGDARNAGRASFNEALPRVPELVRFFLRQTTLLRLIGLDKDRALVRPVGIPLPVRQGDAHDRQLGVCAAQTRLGIEVRRALVLHGLCRQRDLNRRGDLQREAVGIQLLSVRPFAKV